MSITARGRFLSNRVRRWAKPRAPTASPSMPRAISYPRLTIWPPARLARISASSKTRRAATPFGGMSTTCSGGCATDPPAHAKLVTTDSAPGTATAGSLASPSASTMFGSSGQHYNSFNGGNLNLGIWLDDDKRFGIEGSGFALARQTTTYSVGSNNTGNPPLYVPFFNAGAGMEGRLIVADPIAGVAGNVNFVSALASVGHRSQPRLSTPPHRRA